MNVVRKKSIDAVTSSALTQPLEEQNDKRRGSQVLALAAAHDLVTGRFAADIVGVAAELGLADQIQSGPKTAEEIAAAMGLHAPSLYRLLVHSQISASSLSRKMGALGRLRYPTRSAATSRTPCGEWRA